MFKAYWNATKDICNTAARWEECGGKSLEYNQWKCAYYQAYNYIDLLYTQDGNYTNGLSQCITSYLNDLPELSPANYYCGLTLSTQASYSLTLLFLWFSTGSIIMASLIF